MLRGTLPLSAQGTLKPGSWRGLSSRGASGHPSKSAGAGGAVSCPCASLFWREGSLLGTCQYVRSGLVCSNMGLQQGGQGRISGRAWIEGVQGLLQRLHSGVDAAGSAEVLKLWVEA